MTFTAGQCFISWPQCRQGHSLQFHHELNHRDQILVSGSLTHGEDKTMILVTDYVMVAKLNI